eukprot:Nk52_evm11s2650 gene=Nk52_evmTU11s2650
MKTVTSHTKVITALLVVASLILLASASPASRSPRAGRRLFGNLFILGDSLSDVGNLPIAPITNMVDHEGLFSHDPRTGKDFYPPHREFDKCANRVRRVHTMIPDPQGALNNGYGWSEYLLQTVQATHMSPTLGIIPSMSLVHDECLAQVKEKGLEHLSINYAWASATSYGPCKSPSFKPFSGACNPDTVTEAWLANPEESDLDHIKVPPTSVQLDFLLRDIKNGLVKPQKDDLVVVWSGANDLISNFEKLEKGNLANKTEAVEAIVYEIAQQLVKDAVRILDEDSIPMNQLYLINMLNPNLTPEEEQFPGANIVGQQIAQFFNAQVQLHVAAYNVKHIGHKRIHLVSSFKFFSQMADDKHLFGKSFDSRGKPYPCTVPKSEQEKKDNCLGYITQYDGTHPTSFGHQQFSIKLLDYIEKHHNVWA